MSVNWCSGDGCDVSFSDIVLDVESHISTGGNIFIGTDSMLQADGCVFVTAICLHGAPGQQGGRYYFRRSKKRRKAYHELKPRIMHEVSNSIDLGMIFSEMHPDTEIEIHVDVGITSKSKTRPLADMIKGWTRASGFKCKIKPNSWASTAVADKHTK
tara:strand:+ start:42 stop:512 length:471 start_codon:yes stop_codon:yes gene_type:complete